MTTDPMNGGYGPPAYETPSEAYEQDGSMYDQREVQAAKAAASDTIGGGGDSPDRPGTDTTARPQINRTFIGAPSA